MALPDRRLISRRPTTVTVCPSIVFLSTVSGSLFDATTRIRSLSLNAIAVPPLEDLDCVLRSVLPSSEKPVKVGPERLVPARLNAALEKVAPVHLAEDLMPERLLAKLL